MIIEGSLKQFGIDPVSESKRLSRLNPEERHKTFIKNLEAYTNEVIKDEPVSILFYYWLDKKDEVYTDPSLKPIFNLRLQLDPREREGSAIKDTYKTINQAINHPDKAIFWYSPPGPATRDNDSKNPFSQIVYQYGQLYVSYFDKEKINSIAVKVSQEGERWAESLLLQPKFMSIDDFLESNIDDNPIIYRKKGKQFCLDEILHEVKMTFLGKKQPVNINRSQDVDMAKYQITEKFVLNSYLSLIYQHLQQNRRQQIVLSGSCGGKTTSLNDIEDLLGINQAWLKNPFEKLISGFSSQFRILTQGDQKYDYHDGECVLCHKEAKVGPCNVCKQCEKTLKTKKIYQSKKRGI